MSNSKGGTPHSYGTGKNGLPLYRISDILDEPLFNSRNQFPLSSVEELAASIQKNGLDLPVMVRPIDHEVYLYHLVYGHRRLAAARDILGWKLIEAHCREMTETEAVRLNFEENFSRINLTVIEEAQAIARMFSGALSAKVVGEAINKPPSFVSQRRTLLTFPEEVQKMFASGRLKLSHIPAISRQVGVSKQIEFAHEIIEDLSRADGSLTKKGVSRRSTRDRRLKVKTMMVKLLTDGFPAFCPFLLAWAIGDVTDEEFDARYQYTLKELRDGGSLTQTKVWDEAVSGHSVRDVRVPDH